MLAGCSHTGIVNMIQTIKECTRQPIVGIIGGTHLIEAGQERLQATIQALKQEPLEIFGSFPLYWRAEYGTVEKKLLERNLFIILQEIKFFCRKCKINLEIS